MRRLGTILLAILVLFLSAAEATAGAVNIAPLRAVLDSNTRGAAFTIYNNDPVSDVTYRIALTDMVMGPEGAIRPLAEGEAPPAGMRSARTMLRLSPSQVRLKPGESQALRIALRAPEGTPSGEYRAHLMVTALPRTEPPSASGDDRHLSIRLSSLYAVTVPIIVRIGGVSAAPLLENARFVPAIGARGDTLELDLARRGAASVFGDIAVFYAPPSGKAVEVGQIRRVAAYTELERRQVLVALKRPPGDFASGGRLVARRYADVDARGAPLAETAMVLP